MTDGETDALVRRLTEAELDECLRDADDSARLRRLGFIKNLYCGDTVAEAIRREGRSRSTGYRWLEAWNSGGIEAMLPDTSSGRPPKLSEEDQRQLRALIRDRQPCTTATIHDLLQSEFDVEYAPAYLPRVLRDLGCMYTKSAYERAKEADTLDDIKWDSKTHRNTNHEEPYDTQASRLTGGWKLATDPGHEASDGDP